MKKIAYLILFTLILKPLFPVIDYVVNYEYITQVLCINKDKPKMHCDGKCHLMKELAQASETEKPTSSDKKVFSAVEEVLFFEKIISAAILPFRLQAKEKMNPLFTNLYSYLSTSSVFHPPIFMV